MATISVETGSGSASANSYVSEADLTTYATDRGVTISSANKNDLLIQAMDYLESKRFIGSKASSAQALQWPRVDAMVDGYSIDSDSIPQLLIDALCEIALAIDGGTNPLANRGRETKREKIGEIEVEYSPAAMASTYLTAAETKLRKLVRNGLRAYRA